MKILFIGNSFSDDCTDLLYNVAYSCGAKDLILGNLYIGGCTLQRHLQCAEGDLPDYEYRLNVGEGWVTTFNYRLIDALLSREWDMISFQQASGFSGQKESYQPYLDKLVNFVKGSVKNNPKLVWNMTWAYQGDSTHPQFADYGNDQQTMYNAIVSAVKDVVLPTGYFSAVSPTGSAVQMARGILGDRLTRDGYHLSLDKGRFLGALCFAKFFLGLDVKKCAYAPEGVDEKTAKILIDCADKACV